MHQELKELLPSVPMEYKSCSHTALPTEIPQILNFLPLLHHFCISSNLVVNPHQLGTTVKLPPEALPPEALPPKDSLTAFPGDALGSPAVCYGRALAQRWVGAVVDACGLCGLEAAELVESMDVMEVEDQMD